MSQNCQKARQLAYSKTVHLKAGRTGTSIAPFCRSERLFRSILGTNLSATRGKHHMKRNIRHNHSAPYPKPTTSRLNRDVFKALLFLGVGAFLLFGRSARASDTAEAYQWITGMGSVQFSQPGGVFLPTSVLRSMRDGQISPIMQFVLMNHTMNQCISRVLKDPYAPLIRDPYLVAKQKFDYGICYIKKCWQSNMLISLLPMLSSGYDQEYGQQQMGVLLAQAFQKDESCDGTSGNNSIDANIMTLYGLSGGASN